MYRWMGPTLSSCLGNIKPIQVFLDKKKIKKELGKRIE